MREGGKEERREGDREEGREGVREGEMEGGRNLKTMLSTFVHV